MEARRQRCTAHLSDGSRQCERWAINGSTVCATHGGQARHKFSIGELLFELSGGQLSKQLVDGIMKEVDDAQLEFVPAYKLASP